MTLVTCGDGERGESLCDRRRGETSPASLPAAGRSGLAPQVGEANRRLAAQAYDEARHDPAYAALYGEAIGRPDAFSGGAAR
jgi:hypothetical protein